MKLRYAAWYIGLIAAVALLAAGFLAKSWLLSLAGFAGALILRAANQYIPLPKIYRELGIDNRIFEGRAEQKDEAVVVNGLGGTPLMELYILAGEIDRLIRAKHITPVKYLVGNFMTSLEMSGASMSMLRLDEEMKDCLKLPCNTMAWKEG